MKIKKVLSAISALAISVSAFTGMAVTANATNVINTDNGSADFNSSYGDFTINSSSGSSPLEIDSHGWLAVGKGSGAISIPDDELAGPTDTVVVKFKVAYGKLINRSFYYNIADSQGNSIVDFSYDVYWNTIESNILGNSEDLPNSNEFYHGYNTPLTDRAASYTFTFDFKNRTVTQETVNMQNNASAVHVNNLPDGVNNVKTLTIGSDYENTERRCVVDDISITTTSTVHNVTVNYVADAAAIEGLPEGTVTTYTVKNGSSFTPDYPETFTAGDYTYTLESSEPTLPVIVNSDTTITLNYKKAPAAPPELTADATFAQDFTSSADNGASVWTATLNLDGKTYTTIQATATDKDNNVKSSNSEEITTISGESTIIAYIAVNKAQDDLKSVTVTLN